jgi:hypothetical protein
LNKDTPIPDVVDELKETYTRDCGCTKRELYHRLWMYEKRPIPEVVDEKREICQRLSSTTSGIGLFLFDHNL